MTWMTLVASAAAGAPGRKARPGRMVTWLLAGAMLASAPPTLGESERPRVGLVLGGGGARGVAHLGVLRVLEELRVPVDCVAGTSMGALVGGLYASGLPIDDVIDRLRTTDWDALFTDQPPRRERPYRVKEVDQENLFAFELGLRGTELLLPPGATAGYKFEFMLRELMEPVGNFANVDFDDLPIPFRAVATNIEDGTSRVFDAGDPVKAMRASMSVPGAIAPVELDGTLYVDGGLLDNIPVAAARETCADVVIAVNVGSPLLEREDLESAVAISVQMVNVLIEQNIRNSLDSLHARDILITPDLGDFSAADFDNGLTLLPVGEAAARAQADRLAGLALTEAGYQAWQGRVRARIPDVPPIDAVRVATRRGRVNPEVLERELAEVPGLDLQRRAETNFELDNLDRRLEQIYGRGDFERMDYRMIDRPGSRIVEVQGVEKSWGPNYLKLGLSLASDSEQTRFNLAAMYRSTWINDRGAEWRSYASVGFRNELSTEFYQPLTVRSGAFAAARLEARDEPIVYYLDGRRIGDYRVTHARAHLDVGVQNKFGELRVGLFGGVLDADADFGLLTFPAFDVQQVGYTASFVYDQIDDPRFPRDGWFASLKTFGTDEGLGSEDEYNRTELMLLGAASRERHGVHLAAYYGDTLEGELPPYDPLLLGGFLQGSGFRMDELLGDRVAMARLVYSYRLAKLPPQLGSGVFVGGSLEGTLNRFGQDDEQARPSASVFIGAETALGPAFLGLGKAFGDGSPSALYLMLGNP